MSVSRASGRRGSWKLPRTEEVASPTARGYLLLTEATNDPAYLSGPSASSTTSFEHAPEKYRETTLTEVKLHHDIMKAWNDHQAAWLAHLNILAIRCAR
jgi:hypothetical protein